MNYDDGHSDIHLPQPTNKIAEQVEVLRQYNKATLEAKARELQPEGQIEYQSLSEALSFFIRLGEKLKEIKDKLPERVKTFITWKPNTNDIKILTRYENNCLGELQALLTELTKEDV